MTLDLEDKISPLHKEFLEALFGDIFFACFLKDISNCDTYLTLKRLMFYHADEIAEHLDAELNKDEYDNEIKDLKEDIENLYDQLKEIKGGSVFDEMRYDVFIKYCKHMPPWELEAMFENLKTAV